MAQELEDYIEGLSVNASPHATNDHLLLRTAAGSLGRVTPQSIADFAAGGGGGNYVDITQAPYSAVADGTTDCTTAIQAAIDAVSVSGTKKVIYFPPPADPTDFYRCDGELDFSATDGVTMLGDGARVEPTQDIISTALVYTGTTGPFIAAGMSRGLTFRGLAIQTNNASFTGDLVSLDNNTSPRVTYATAFIDCMFGGRSVTALNARSGINMAGAIELHIDRCVFGWLDYGVISKTSTSLRPCNAIYITGTRFTEYNEWAMNLNSIQQGWIAGNVFEFRTGSQVAGGITDLLIGGSGERGMYGVTIHGNGFWDCTSGTWIDIKPHGVDIRGNYVGLEDDCHFVMFTGGAGTRVAVGANYVTGTSGGTSNFINVQTSALEVLADDGSNVVSGFVTYNANEAATGYRDGQFHDLAADNFTAIGDSPDGFIHVRRAVGSNTLGGHIIIDRNDSTNWRGGAIFSYFDSTTSKDRLAFGMANSTTSPAAIANMKAYLTEDGDFGLINGLVLPEVSDPAAPAANTGILYVKDNGAGKSQLCVRFPTGAVQVIATEP